VSDADGRAVLDQQAAEIGAALESLLVPALDRRLGEALRQALASVAERLNAADMDLVSVAVSSAYFSLRELLNRLGDQSVAIYGDASAWHTEQEQHASAAATALAALLLAQLASAARITALETEVAALRVRLADTSSE